MKLIKPIFWVCVVLTFFMWSYAISHAHESNGWKHLVGNSGGIIGQKVCPTGFSLWFQDKDSDGELDACTGIIFSHDAVHIRPFKMVVTDGKLDCSCEPVAEGI